VSQTTVGDTGAPTGPGGALVDGDMLARELATALDERTIQILERRRATAKGKRRGWLVRRALMWADVLGLSLSFALSELLFTAGADSLSRVNTSVEILIFILTLPVWLVVAKMYGLYDRDESRANHTTTDDIVGVFHLVTICSWLLLVGAWVSNVVSPAFSKVVLFWLIAIPAVTLLRAGARAICRRRLSYVQNTVIVGAGNVGQLLARKILQHPEYGINLIGIVDNAPLPMQPGLEHVAWLGSDDRLVAIIQGFDVERVMFAFSNDSFERTVDLIRSLKDLELQVDIVPRLFDLVTPTTEIHALEGISLLGIPPLHLSRSSRLLKRTMDVILASAGLVLLAPLFGLVAAWIKVDSSGPVLFRQLRIGSEGRLFQILKFRTMAVDAEERKAALRHLNKHAQPGSDSKMFKIPDDPRVTHAGRFLRRYSLDELPQLVNVLRGEMSLVGPRPLILDEGCHVDEWARRRLDLRPGMTGLWQVLGRSDIPFDEMVKLDYQYVTTWSLWHDFRLLFRTIPLIVQARGGSY
jgi:exopolysaccharide biosynthesis polyprenyl glycosylphosphotransferase